MRLFGIFILLLGNIVFTYGQAQDHLLEELVCKEMHAHTQFVAARGPEYLDDASFDLHYARFVWSLDPNVKAISGTVTQHFQVKQDGLATLQFELSSQLVIDSIMFRGVKLTYAQVGNYGLTVNLPQALALGTLDSLAFTYHGVPPTTGFGSFNKSSHAGVPILWSLSCPLGTRDWWPCKNGLTDKIDSIDILITTPSQYRAAGIGTLVAETVVGNQTTFHWAHRYPIVPYLVAFAVTNYVQYTDNVPLKNGTQLPMVNYVYPETLNTAKTGTADLVQVLQFYDSLFVGYPFAEEKYGHAQFGWGGGMEHQTMSFVTDFSWALLAHELAHQWFGDMVTCGSWQDVWLNEGAATYLEGLTQEHFKSPATWLNWKKGKVNNIVSVASGSVWVDDTTSVNRIFSSRLTYNKGAYLFHMLRWKMGDDAFFAGIRTYLNDKQFDFAKTASFQGHLEQASGQNLTEYFKDWFLGQGYPRYQVQWSQDANNQLVVQLGQTQSHSSVSFFEMPVPIQFIGQGQDTILRFEHTSLGQVFTAQLPFEVTSVVFDPEVWLISANNTITKITTATGEASAGSIGLRVLPNPVKNEIAQLWVTPQQSGKAQISIQQLSGETLFSQTNSLVVGENQVALDLSTMSSGVYLVRIEMEEGYGVCRLVKL